MSNIIYLHERKNIYIIDNYYVVLADTSKQAINYISVIENKNKNEIKIKKLDLDKELIFVRKGRFSEILWDRDIKDNEETDYSISVKDFIYDILKGVNTPYIIETIED
jgi:hypothetical protein